MGKIISLEVMKTNDINLFFRVSRYFHNRHEPPGQNHLLDLEELHSVALAKTRRDTGCQCPDLWLVDSLRKQAKLPLKPA